MSDSVGKISLDLEVKSDLSKQMSTMATAIGKKLEQSLGGGISSVLNMLNKSIESSMKSINATIKAALDEMKANAQATINSIVALTKNIKVSKQYSPVQSMTPVTNAVNNATQVRGPPKVANFDTEAIKAKIQNLSATLDNVNERIQAQQDKLAKLKEAYNTTFSEKRKNILNEQILKTEASINRLIGQSDRLGFQLNDLDGKLKSAGNSAGSTSNKLNNASNNVNKYSNNTKKATKKTSLLGSIMKKVGDNSNSLSKKISSASNSIMANLKKIYKYAMAFMGFKVGIRAIRTIGKYLRETFKVNEQFSASLAQVKTNLMIAFTPILNNVMPILNQFMAWLSKATQYIASFTSAIFGTTYNASKEATQQLINAKKAMGLYGDTTKKTKNMLMGFDEINKLTKDDDSSSDNTPVLVNPSLDTSVVDAQMKALADKVKGVLGKVFEPMKSAWNKEGQNTINAAKYALGSIKKVINDIGKSFEEVWTNGTGEKTCTLILKILQLIFNIIGDIANSFDKAWNSGGTGTAIIQCLFDILNNVLECVVKIGENFRNAWNDNGAGDKLLSSILGLLKNIVEVLADVTSGMSDSFGKATETLFPAMIEFATSVSNSLSNITEGFKIIWDNGGQKLFDGIVQLIAQVAELIMKLSSGVFADFSTLFKDILAPAIGAVFDAIGTLLEWLGKVIEWINSNQGVIEGITTVIEIFAAAWAIGAITNFIVQAGGLIGILGSIAGALTATTVAQTLASVATTAWSGVCAVASVATTILGAAFTFLTSPIGLVILAITAVIAIGVLLYKHWDTVKEKCGQVWDWIKNKFQAFDDWLQGIFSKDWSKSFGFLGDLLNGFFASVKGIWDAIKLYFQGIIDFVAGVFTGDWSRAWKGVKEIFKSVFDGLIAVAKYPINCILGFINGLISGINIAIKGLNKLKIKIPDWVPGLGGKDFGFNIPQIPKINYLARGGIINQPTLSMVGEAGKEAVVPLENNTGGLDMIANKIAERLSTNNNNGNNDRPLQIQLILADGTSLGHATISSVNEIARMNGTSSLLT